MMIKQLFLFGIVFIGTLGLCEVFTKTSHLGSVSTTEFYPERGRGKRTNLKYLMFNEGFGIGEYNEYGYIGEARPPKKPDNTIRIILMGDSFIESWQVFERHQFGKITEGILAEKFPDKNIEVLNFGHSNLDLMDQYIYYKTFAEKFNADFTLFMLADYNLEPRYWDQLRPKAIIENDSLVLTYDFPAGNVASYENTKILTQNFSLMHMLNKARKKAQGQPLASILLEKVYTWFKPVNQKSEKEEKEEAYEQHPVTNKILESLDSDEVVFVSRHITPLPIEFKKACLDNGFGYIELSDDLQALKEQGSDPYEWKVSKKSGHWNHKAHEIVAHEIAEQLARLVNSRD